MARYPEIRVSVRSSNPLAVVAAVRQALRRAGISKHEISRFSDEAFASSDAERTLGVCRAWVTTEVD